MIELYILLFRVGRKVQSRLSSTKTFTVGNVIEKIRSILIFIRQLQHTKVNIIHEDARFASSDLVLIDNFIILIGKCLGLPKILYTRHDIHYFL